MYNKPLLEAEAFKLNLDIDATAFERFDTFSRLLVEWNEKMNLTSILDPDGIAIKHFGDSLSLLKYVDIPQNANVIDIGTGAGLPAIPLLIMRGDLKITMLDSLQKRLTFIDAVLKELGLSGTLLHSRAEDGGKDEKYRETFDLAVARAVANMAVLSEYCLPYVKLGGSFVAMKGIKALEEMENCDNAIKCLGGKIESKNSFIIGEDQERMIINVKKISQTPLKYPRQGSKIAKKPL